MTEKPKPNPLSSILQRLEAHFQPPKPQQICEETEELIELKFLDYQGEYRRRITEKLVYFLNSESNDVTLLIPIFFSLQEPLHSPSQKESLKQTFGKINFFKQINLLLELLDSDKKPMSVNLASKNNLQKVAPIYLLLEGLRQRHSYWIGKGFWKVKATTPDERKQLIEEVEKIKSIFLANIAFWDIDKEKDVKEKVEEILSKTLNFEELEEYENYVREIIESIQKQIEEHDEEFVYYHKIRTTTKEYQNQILSEIPRNQVEKDLKDIVQQRDRTPQTEEEKDDFFKISYLLSKDLKKIGLSKDHSDNIILTMSDDLASFSSDTFEKYLKPILGRINQNDAILITLISKLSSDNPKTANFSWLFVDKNEKKGYKKRRELIAGFGKTLKDLFTHNSDLRNYLDTFFVQSIEGKYPDSDPFYKVLASILYQHYENKKTIKNETLSKEIFDNFIQQPGVAEALLALRKIYLGVLLTENLEYFPKDESDENKPIINPDASIFSFDDERKIKEMRENKQSSAAYLNEKTEEILTDQIIYLLLEKNFSRNKLEVTKTPQENEISITVSSDSIGDDGYVTINLGGEEIKVTVVIEGKNQLKFFWKNEILGSMSI